MFACSTAVPNTNLTLNLGVEIAVAYLTCHYLPYQMQIVMDPSEGDHTVCLGPAILFCQQCSKTYCRECDTRRHC